MTPEQKAIFAEIAAERDRQDVKFGVCDHRMVPDCGLWVGLSAGESVCKDLGVKTSDEAREESQTEFRMGRGSFAHIVVEESSEFFEACADEGETSDHAREEAVQNAAVWVAIIESIDRKRAAK